VEALGGFALIAAIVVVVVVWGKLKDAASDKVNQTILDPRAHKLGKELTEGALAFTCRASAHAVVEKVLDHLALPNGNQSAVLGRLYVLESGDDGIVFESGSKVRTSFRAALHVVESLGATRGTLVITNWTVSGGIVSDTSQMKILEQRIREAVAALDAEAEFSRTVSSNGR
jgi:hypothetical protein